MPRLFRVFFFRPSGRQPLADRFARVLTAVGRPGHGVARLLFFLADNPVGRVSAVERIVRAFPQAAPFVYHGPAGPPHHRPASDILSNYPPPWTEHNPNRPDGSLAPELLEEILRGIPRRFPVFEAGVIFDGVDWPGTGQGLAAGPAHGERDPATPIDWQYRYPSVSIGMSARDEYPAVVECADPSAALDPVTTAKLDRLGPVCRQDVRAGFAAGELAEHLRRKAEAEVVVGEFKARLDTWLADRVRLPYDWPPGREQPGTEVRFSLREPLLKSLRPMGWRARPEPSGSATFSLLKPTSGHHVLHLYADRGTWSRRVSCQFRFIGLEKSHAIDLPAGRGVQYPAGDQPQVDRVVANWAAVVEALERDLVPRLEAIYGDDPPWFPAITLGGR